MKISLFGAFSSKTAYLKCLLLSTWDPNWMKLETQSGNDVYNSVMQDVNKLQHRNTQMPLLMEISSKISSQ